MDGTVDDSGFDSDQNKMPSVHNNSQQSPNDQHSNMATFQYQDESSLASIQPHLHGPSESGRPVNSDSALTRPLTKSSDLQKKIEKQCAASRRHRGTVVSSQPTSVSSRSNVISRNRLLVPRKSDVTMGAASDTEPLVIIDMDESEDEFSSPRLTKKAHREISEQLIKDGYNLDLQPDDDDLDLIPPRPLSERCICCNAQVNCGIQ